MRWLGMLIIVGGVAFCIALLSRMPVPEELREGVQSTVRTIAEATAEHDPAAQRPAPTEIDPPTATITVPEPETDPEDTDNADTEPPAEEPVETAANTPAPESDAPGPVDRVKDYVTRLGRAAGLIGEEEPAAGTTSGISLAEGAAAPPGHAAPWTEETVLLAAGRHIVLD
ncbi:MAG: hypothetical protein AAFN05_15865, partial [Pseudomonadota bacterium]